MERKLFAIYDPDPEFVFRFMEYVKTRLPLAMDVRAYTGEEHLKQAVEQTPPEILLVSSLVLTEEVKRFPVGNLVVLQENPDEEEQGMRMVYKYQSPGEVLRKTLEFCEQKAARISTPVRKEGMEVIGVYSPVGRTRKTSFALTLGQILAENRPVLYLNFEMFAGFEQLFSERYNRDLSDLMYYARQKPEELSEKLAGMVCRIRKLDYVPPARCPDDLQNIQAEEWLDLFQRLGKQTSYEVVILDLSDAVHGLPEMLSACDRIYIAVRSDPVSRAKTEQFLWTLEEMQGKETTEKICRIRIPFSGSERAGKEYFTDLMAGELGNLVRREISKGVETCRQS